MGEIGSAFGIEFGAEHVRDMREGDEFVALGQDFLGGVEIDLPVRGQRANVDRRAGLLGD